jgi:hypothetical protein
VSADDAGQWPFPSQRKADQRAFELGVGRVAEQRDELAAMLKRATHHVASLGMVDGVSADVKRTALAFCNEAKALLQRTGSDR